MLVNRRLVLAHFWLAFAVFGLALCLGAWQMFVRSPLYTWISNPEWYYRSLTAHGTVMGYVFPTLVAMGFGYAISESALQQRLVGVRWAWAGFWLIVAGADHGDGARRAWPRLGALHFLSAPDRQRVLLPRRRARRRRLLDLGRADVDQPARLAPRSSGRASAARDVRQRGRILSLGLDGGRRRTRIAAADHPGRVRPERPRSMPAWRACSSPGRCTPSCISG